MSERDKREKKETLLGAVGRAFDRMIDPILEHAVDQAVENAGDCPMCHVDEPKLYSKEELFLPTSIGTIPVKNHFVRSATHERAAGEAGAPTPEVAEIYRKLAKGGVGTIITSFARIAPYEQPSVNQLAIFDDAVIPAYRELAEMVHEHGTRIVMQIVHGSSKSQVHPETARILGPSAVPNPDSGLVPREMTREDMDEVIRLFAEAAVRVKEAGFDGVQLHHAHGYLLAQFLSPLTNQRTDEYGGSVENRMRFALEVYRAVREAVGNFPIWVKMSCSDEREGGLGVDEFVEAAELLSRAGIDAIEISGERWSSHPSADRAYYTDAAVALAKRGSTPIILTGGIRELADTERALKGGVSLFGLARPLFKDPAYLKTMK